MQSLAYKGSEAKEKRATCKYKRICGGRRLRVYATSGDYLAEDPACCLGDREER